MTTQKYNVSKGSAEKLSTADLKRYCVPESLGFETTEQLHTLQNFIGQPRAYRAFEMGSQITGKGFNLFVMGLPASGRTTLSREYLEINALKHPPPNDWCYVNNFNDPHQPNALSLPVGKGNELRKDLQTLVAHISQELQRAFQSKEYQEEHDKLSNLLKKEREKLLNRLQAFAAKYNFLIVRTALGFVLVPSVDGQPLKPEEIEKLPPEKIEKYRQLESKVGDEVKNTLKQIRELERSVFTQIQELNKHTALFVVEPLILELKEKYIALPSVISHFEAVQADIVENVDLFRSEEEGEANNLLAQASKQGWISRYDVNVLVDNSTLQGAPVIVETHPTYQNLIGRIEHQFVMGASKTDFMMIRPGALHKANGGYLIIPVRDVLLNSYAWEGLKRSLKDDCIRIAELGNQLGLISSVTLEPEPIPLDIKVVLVGTPMLYYLLRTHDEDFPKLFKVRAEFTTQMDRTPETENEYALFVKSVTDQNNLNSFNHRAVAKIIEHGSRIVSDQNKLSTRFGHIADLIREAEYWSKKNGQEVVDEISVERAIEEGIYRSNLAEEEIQEMITQGTFIIDIEGSVVGQINALSVIAMGEYAFGRPTRVTAAVSPGKAGVIDIERKAELGGPIHTKGVLILSGFISSRYGRNQSLNLSASLTFEQSYSGVEGDSASAAELFALLSAIGQIPLRQDIAITGSLNQHGSIQPIGGVNEKIEGFFAVCKQKGLTGKQGVIIPDSNRKHLMLKDEVIQAVANKKFNIWTIKNVDEGIELLTGNKVGNLDDQGIYPEGTFNRHIINNLEAFTNVLNKQNQNEDE